MIEVQTSILCTLLLLKASLISATTYYCQIGNTQTIVGETSGTIRTVESGSSYYGNNFNCNWIINGGTGYKIQLTVTGLNLQHSPSYTSCGTYDHLSIKDGNTSAADEITAICGEKNPYEVISSGQYLYLNFYSNDKNFYDHTGVTVNFQVFGENDCPPNWTSLNTTDKCYKIKQVPGIDWNSAFSNCLYSRANLAVVDHHLVFDNLVAYGKGLPVTSAWVALTDIETEGVFMWLDEQKLAGYISTYENNEDNDCAVLNFDTQRFIMQECERDKHLAVCQRNKVGKTDIYAIPKEKEKENNPEHLNVKVILIIVSVLLACVVITVIVVCKLKRRRRYKRAHQDVTMDSVHDGAVRYSDSDRHRSNIEQISVRRSMTNVDSEGATGVSTDHPAYSGEIINSSDKTPLPAGVVVPSAPGPEHPPAYEDIVNMTRHLR